MSFIRDILHFDSYVCVCVFRIFLLFRCLVKCLLECNRRRQQRQFIGIFVLHGKSSMCISMWSLLSLLLRLLLSLCVRVCVCVCRFLLSYIFIWIRLFFIFCVSVQHPLDIVIERVLLTHSSQHQAMVQTVYWLLCLTNHIHTRVIFTSNSS